MPAFAAAVGFSAMVCPLEMTIVGWLARGLLILAGIVTGWFISRDAPNLCRTGMIAVMLLGLVVCWHSGRRAGRTSSTA